LTINPDIGCNKKDDTSADLSATQLNCVNALGAEFKSPFLSSKLGKSGYIAPTASTVKFSNPPIIGDFNNACSLGNKGSLVVATDTTTNAAIVACSNEDSPKVLSFEVIPAGSEWAPS
jgi:hypothetical protein